MRTFNVPVTISRYRNHRKAGGAERRDCKLPFATNLCVVCYIFTIDTKLHKFENHLQVHNTYKFRSYVTENLLC